MRILCITNLFPNPVQPGKGIFNWRQLALLAQRMPVKVIAPIAWTDVRQQAPRASELSFQHEWQQWNGVDVAYARYVYTPGMLRRLYGRFMLASLRRTFRWAHAQFQPDLIYACWAYPDGWAAWKLAREHKLPIALKIHGSDLLLLDQYPNRAPGTIETLRNVDAVLAVSRDLHDRAIQLGAPADRTHVVYAGTDTKLFSPGDRGAARQELGLPVAGRRLLFVGNLIPLKGILHLLEACRRLNDEGFAVEADLLGDGPQREELVRTISEFGLTEKVRLRGWQPPASLPNWYRAADLVVLPSSSEGIPNVLVEATACGTPFVATNVGGIPEISHLSQYPLVPFGEPEVLGAVIKSALDDTRQKNARSTPAVVVSTEESVDTMLSIFADILASPTSSRTPVDSSLAAS